MWHGSLCAIIGGVMKNIFSCFAFCLTLTVLGGTAVEVIGASDAIRASAEFINGQLYVSVTNVTSTCVQSELQVAMKGYPPYMARLAPFEGCRINLTNLRPVIPQHRIGRDAWYAPKGWWERRHKEKLAAIAKGPDTYDMVFVGDSITHNWEGWLNPDEAKFIDALHNNGKGRLKNGARPAADSWDAMAAKYRVLNLGYGGDCTQHVLWRIANGEMDGYKAKNVMLMIGTNNAERPDAVVNGIKAVVEAIRSKQPEARILLSAIFPRQASSQHKKRKRNDYINSKIKELADGEKVVWLDFNAKFLKPDGTLTREMFPDLLHPAAEGYRIWFNEVKPFLTGTVREADIHGPEAWLEFMGGNVRKDGLRADLEAIKAAGLKGVHFFHISRAGVWPDCPEQIPCMSEKWGDVVSFLGDECRRLGLRLVVQNCPGWSQSGGPWIAVTNAMREAVCSRMDFAVGDKVRLPEISKKYADADSDWRDIAVLAFPLPEGDGAGELIPASSKRDGDTETYEFASPVTVRTITLPSPKLYNNNYTYHAPWLSVRLEAFDAGGKAHTVLDTPLPTSSWRDYVLPLTLACDEFTAKKWRFTLQHKYPIQRFKGPKFFSAARHADWEMKSGLVLRSLLYEKPPKQSSSAWVESAKVQDISHLRKDDGTLNWHVPSGRWTVLRVAHVNSKRVNSPAPKEATGWECDKLAPEGAEANFNGYVGMLADGPLKGRLDGMLVDSWECFGQTWTPRMEQYFSDANGYAVRKWLPALFGWVVDNPSETERVLTDWRRTIGNLITKNYYGHMAKLAHERGIGILYETAFGDIISGDILEYWKYSDAPMCEYWLPHKSILEGHVGCYAYKPIRPCASAAHIYGKRRVTAEAFTGWGISWKEDFKELRDVANRHFAKGVTHLALQSYTHAPSVNATPPGGCMGGFNGTPFTRLQTWWRHMPEFTAWLTKCEELLEEGVPSNDVLWYLGDAVGHKPDEYYAFPEGYAVDYLNHDVLTNRLTVKNGLFTIPEGTSWKVLWVPDEHFMLPATLNRLAELAKVGGKVVFGGKDRLAKALASIRKDVATVPALGDGLNEDFMWLHRKVGAMDRYFVAAGTNGWTGKVAFRANGAAAVYDPVSGERYAWRNGGVLELHPSQSVFVEFGGETASKCRNQKREVVCKFAPWRLSFPKGWGAPESVTLNALRSWTEIPGFTAEAKAYSGTGVYETEFDFGGVADGARCILDLGRVESIAKVYLNGKEVRTLWCKPYSCDVTEFVKKGRNVLKVEVTNTWRNRVVYDLNQPEKDRKTWILYQKNFNPPLDSPLIPAGILGPVKLFGIGKE